jgi:hypothetical protein
MVTISICQDGYYVVANEKVLKMLNLVSSHYSTVYVHTINSDKYVKTLCGTKWLCYPEPCVDSDSERK